MSLNSIRRRRRRDALLAVGLGVAVACTVPAVAGAAAPEVITNGLSNPRGMTFGPDGRLYVAEAGKGGSGPCIPGPPGEPEQCYGATGAITRVNVNSGRTRRIVNRLPSLASQEPAETTGDPEPGSDATGPHDVSFDGERAYFTIGLGANPSLRADLGRRGPEFAGLYRINRRGEVRRVTDLGAYEATNDPDAGRPSAEVNTNPFSVDATIGERILVTDAGGNDLLLVQPGGAVSTRSVFPFGSTLAPPFLGLPPGTLIPYQPVPTGVVRVPAQGAVVGQLTGFPFPAGEANVYKIASRRTVRAAGFTTIIDVAYHNSSLYVLQISSEGLLGESPGKLTRIDYGGKRTELAPGELNHPTGLAVSQDGDVYVSDNGGSPTDGEIVRIPAED